MAELSPGPWKIEDHEGRGHKLVDADGKTIALAHYPKESVQMVNMRGLRMVPDLVKMVKSLSYVVALGKQNGVLSQAAAKLLHDIEHG